MRLRIRLVQATLALCLGAAAALIGTAPAQAQDFPARRLTIVVGFPPGAIIDWTARVVGEQLQKQWGQPVIIDNRVGGGGLVAMQAVTNLPPDGYALVAYASTQAAIPVFTRPAIDPEKDLVAVTTSGYTAYFLVANGTLPVASLRELAGYARANPGKLNIGVSAANSTPELSAAELQQRLGAPMTLVSYNGAAPAQRAVMANETQLWIASMFGLDDIVKSGKLKVLGVLDDKRFPAYPDVPTFGSAMGQDLVSVAYLTYQARSGTPPAVLEKWYRGIAEVIARPEVGERIRKAGFEPVALPQAEAQKMMEREYAHAREVARSVGIQPK